MATYDENTWRKIKQEWLAGQLSISDISRSHGPTRQAINKRAKTDNWPPRGSLVEEVRREVKSRLLEDDSGEKVTA